jgi:hypothetical protein
MTRTSEGHASAKRILKEKTVTQLHRVDASQIECCDHSCNEGRTCPIRIEFAGPEPVDYSEVEQLKREGNAAFVIVMLILALILIAFYSFTA